MQNFFCQIALFSSKTATESLKSYTVCCFDLQFCVNLKLYSLGFKWLTAHLLLTKTRLKDPMQRQNKEFLKSLYLQIDNWNYGGKCEKPLNFATSYFHDHENPKTDPRHQNLFPRRSPGRIHLDHLTAVTVARCINKLPTQIQKATYAPELYRVDNIFF